MPGLHKFLWAAHRIDKVFQQSHCSVQVGRSCNLGSCFVNSPPLFPGSLLTISFPFARGIAGIAFRHSNAGCSVTEAEV